MYIPRIVYFASALFLFLNMSCKQEIGSDLPIDTAVLPVDQVSWMSIEEAEKAMEKEPKDIFVMVYANWCPHCKNYDQTTYKDPKVIKDLHEKFYPVKLNAHNDGIIKYKGTEFTNPNYDSSKSKDELNSYHEIVYELQAGSIPSIVFVDKNMNVKGTELGYKPADELRSLMAMYRSN